MSWSRKFDVSHTELFIMQQHEAFSASTEYWVKKSTLSRTDRLYTRNNSIPTYLLSILFFPDKTEESLELVSLAWDQLVVYLGVWTKILTRRETWNPWPLQSAIFNSPVMISKVKWSDVTVWHDATNNVNERFADLKVGEYCQAQGQGQRQN